MKKTDRCRLRETILEQRDRLTAEGRRQKSAAITSHLLGINRVLEAECIMVYMHFRSEVQTDNFIDNCLRAARVVAVPVTLPDISEIRAVRINDPEKDVEPGYCLIPEPKDAIIKKNTLDPAVIDVVIVPGSVFDRDGGRLGYGGGYYDRFLSVSAPAALRIGLAYELQVIGKVPTEAHDQYMDIIVTEKNIYNCKGV